jgi:hypothetical protein
MEFEFDRNKSLQELEQSDWGEPTFDSYLVTTVHRLRRKPLAEFTVEDLRIMIGQRFSLRFLLPLAFERLEENPMVDGDMYNGDLLSAVLHIDESYWQNDAAGFQRLRSIVGRVVAMMPELDDIDRETVEQLLARARRLTIL